VLSREIIMWHNFRTRDLSRSFTAVTEVRSLWGRHRTLDPDEVPVRAGPLSRFTSSGCFEQAKLVFSVIIFTSPKLGFSQNPTLETFFGKKISINPLLLIRANKCRARATKERPHQVAVRHNNKPHIGSQTRGVQIQPWHFDPTRVIVGSMRANLAQLGDSCKVVVPLFPHIEYF
jgi:hypothetical protein